ncbi:MAG: hypothetical protein KM310_00185 [Clostridiales bacterium]|nr:hypothetical protein [Clostridiales bacterium]
MTDVLLIDPRARDLPEDSLLWEFLLARCSDEKLRISLHAFRAAGTRLAWRNNRWIIEPILDPRQGWSSYEEYRRLRDQFLLPKRLELTRLLAELPPPEVGWP